MDRRIIRARTIVVVVTTIVLGVVAVSAADAQTLTDPYPKTTNSPPSTGSTKSRSAAHVKNCSAYGAGFMVMPGTDACIKIGGSVTVEAGH
jgi:Porin subfamily